MNSAMGVRLSGARGRLLTRRMAHPTPIAVGILLAGAGPDRLVGVGVSAGHVDSLARCMRGPLGGQFVTILQELVICHRGIAIQLVGCILDLGISHPVVLVQLRLGHLDELGLAPAQVVADVISIDLDGGAAALTIDPPVLKSTRRTFDATRNVTKGTFALVARATGSPTTLPLMVT